MREIFVSELVKEVLGPRRGPREMMAVSPLTEYISGVLAPIPVEPVAEDIDAVAELPSEESGDFEDEAVELDVSPPPLLAPALDPKSKPHSMGLSFILESQTGIPGFDVCVTWARYHREEEQGGCRWRREPRHFVGGITCTESQAGVILIDGEGHERDNPQDAEVSLHFIFRPEEGNRNLVSIYLVNRIHPPSPDEYLTTEFHVFQPELRVRCVDGTAIVSGLKRFPDSEEERQLSFLYRRRPVLARGHLCAAVWKEIDAQQDLPDAGSLDFAECRSDPPFHWTDGELLPDGVRQQFSIPDVRTEFVPLYPVQFPELQWPTGYGNSPALEAAVLAEAWDPTRLRTFLQPLADGYRSWIGDLRREVAGLRAGERQVANRLIRRCVSVAERIEKGINVLVNDEDARLAFCFANRAMEVQFHWARSQSLSWYPFQLAFIVMTMESIVNPRSSDRDTCDLLWVPTGVGKTEAYLAIAALVLAYRRRRALTGQSGNPTGAGTSVISRYTLRLLTIQQFRRALRMVTACELLRVYNLSDADPVGWRPAACLISDNLIWGSARFSIGLWVGGGVAPNRLEDTWARGSGTIYGALSILEGRDGEGEPAQVLNCPACNSVLSVPVGGLTPGTHSLHLAISTDLPREALEAQITRLTGTTHGPVSVTAIGTHSHSERGFFTLTLQLSSAQSVSAANVEDVWAAIQSAVIDVRLQPARASRPGYFLRWYQGRTGPKNYDFEIFCANPECPLRRPWCEGAPSGFVLGRTPHAAGPTSGIQGIPGLPNGNRFAYVNIAFKCNSPYVSDRIPIPGYTVDTQVYHRCPSVVISTVDKFARLPFQPRASALFGNVEYHHCVHGFYRAHQHSSASDVNGHPGPTGLEGARNYTSIQPFDPPDLILQDELHLIQGPLGSLVGIYETALDFLCTQGREHRVKYIASTATIRRADEQVQSVFARQPVTFPPPGLLSEDTFFIRFSKGHALDDGAPGRLYVGICAPGRGPLTPIRNIWSRLLHTAWQHAHQSIDPFWTLVGYFNAIRELAGARALYRQDIPARVNHISSHGGRRLPDDRCQELSSRTDSTHLPSILDLLEHRYPDAQDALFTTSMFGTGVNIRRLGLMVVHGQPKTTAAYIQSTGRVGRSRGGLVVTFLRATRPRDLNHYEFFCGYHSQLHRFVEPITVYPFSPGALARACGPVAVFMLRNMRNPSVSWNRDESVRQMHSQRTVAPEVQDLPSIFERRARSQPRLRQPQSGYVQRFAESELDKWSRVAAQVGDNLRYVEYAIATSPTCPVVLGDPQHERAGLDVVFGNAPQSLRDVEETTGFQT